jgi:hypothetical protein
MDTTTPMHVHAVDGVQYVTAVAIDGWTTGPCKTADIALARLVTYERGDEVTEAAPNQCSRAQMKALLAWARAAGIRDAGQTVDTIQDAIHGGLHSDEWTRASAIAVKMWRGLPPSVRLAGSAMIRRIPGVTS